MKIEKTGWYKDGNDFLAFYDLQKGIIYGLDEDNDWFLTENWEGAFYLVVEPATESEALERLKAEAIRRGYVEGVEVKCLSDSAIEKIMSKDLIPEVSFDNENWLWSHHCACIMKHGKWAEITKPAEQPQEKTFPRMMEVRDDDHEVWRKREIYLIYDGMVWSRISNDRMEGWKQYREIEEHENQSKIEVLEKQIEELIKEVRKLKQTVCQK